jgi:hypothetical protein
MFVDYDLSNLPDDQAELWVWLRTDEIRGQIMAAQAERLGLPLALGRRMGLALTEKPQPIFDNGGLVADAETSVAEKKEV